MAEERKVDVMTVAQDDYQHEESGFCTQEEAPQHFECDTSMMDTHGQDCMEDFPLTQDPDQSGDTEYHEADDFFQNDHCSSPLASSHQSSDEGSPTLTMMSEDKTLRQVLGLSPGLAQGLSTEQFNSAMHPPHEHNQSNEFAGKNLYQNYHEHN